MKLGMFLLGTFFGAYCAFGMAWITDRGRVAFGVVHIAVAALALTSAILLMVLVP